MRICGRHGIRFPCQQGKILTTSNPRIRRLAAPLTIASQPLPVVDFAKYLGIMVSGNGIAPKEHVQELEKRGWAAFSHACGCDMNRHGFPVRFALAMYKTFVRSTMEYGLALGMFTQDILKPLSKIQNAFIQHVLKTNATKSGAALLGLPAIYRHSCELSACFHARIETFDETTLTWHISQHFNTESVVGLSNTSLACLNHNLLWRTLVNGASVSAADRIQWGWDECTKLARHTHSIQLMKPNCLPDISFASSLPRCITNLLIGWCIGSLSAVNHTCPKGHQLSHSSTSSCASASSLLHLIDFQIPSEFRNVPLSVVDAIFPFSPRKRWTSSDPEVVFLSQVLKKVLEVCNEY